ncbi:alpha/beta fold hydrolase [Ramlibacter sp. AN1133]|uniref:alpha/beta fold hydrolase n=1 Tax=Ramlibacter sp. AN1133 TaxID=3133429 RepID=UPI0030C4E6A5
MNDQSAFSLAPHTTGTVRSGEVEVFYRRFGVRTARPPVLIAHGLSYFSYDWIQIAGDLCRDREVVAIDLRGFGDSTCSDAGAYELQDFSCDIVAVLNHLGWMDAVLVGHSMGGRICLVTAAWEPQRVRGLVCLDFAPDVAAAGRRKVAERIGEQPDLFTSVDHAMAYHGHENVPVGSPLRARWEEFLHRSPGGWVLKRDLHFRNSFRRMLATGSAAPSPVDLWAMVRDLRMPALFVRGAQSDMFAAETVDKLRTINDRVEVVEIAGGHALMEDNPAGVVAQVQRFLMTLN